MLKKLYPTNIFSLITKTINVTTTLFLVLIFYGLIQSLWISPIDYIQGHTVRIMYVHVPSSWIALGCFASIGFFSILNFIYKNKIPLQKAIDLPRIRHNNGNEIFVEKGFNKNFYLDKKNFSIKVFKKKNRLFGGVTAIKVNSNKTLSRGADKRRNCY